MSHPSDSRPPHRSRREFLWNSGAGFAGVAMSGLLGDDFLRAQTVAADGRSPWALGDPGRIPPGPHHKPKAKAVIFLYMLQLEHGHLAA